MLTHLDRTHSATTVSSGSILVPLDLHFWRNHMLAGESQVYKNIFNKKYSLMQKYRREKNSKSEDQLFLSTKPESSEDILVKYSVL